VSGLEKKKENGMESGLEAILGYGIGSQRLAGETMLEQTTSGGYQKKDAMSTRQGGGTRNESIKNVPDKGTSLQRLSLSGGDRDDGKTPLVGPFFGRTISKGKEHVFGNAGSGGERRTGIDFINISGNGMTAWARKIRLRKER